MQSLTNVGAVLNFKALISFRLFQNFKVVSSLEIFLPDFCINFLFSRLWCGMG